MALGGVPLRLTDTAGLRETDDRVEAIGVRRAADLVEAADVLVWLGEPSQAPPHRRNIKVHAKSDLPERRGAPEGSFAVSAETGQGVAALMSTVESYARAVLPAEDAIALNHRQALHVEEATDALIAAAGSSDLVLVAEHLRIARAAFDRLTGRAGVEDVLDALFGRFCLGK